MPSIARIGLLLASITGICLAYNAAFTINAADKKGAISKLIYGHNWANGEPERYTACRIGGDRLPAYNWENNMSNGGSYMAYVNDNYLVQGFPVSDQSKPGIVLTKFQDRAIANGYYSIQTLQLGGYVAADGSGRVTTAAPSSRWKQTRMYKGSALSLTPDLSDAYVNMDEMVSFLISKYGLSTSANGVDGWSMDNEPDLWSETHGMMHPAKVTCAELISKTIAGAGMIKSLDPGAEIYGPVLSGFYGYYTLSDAPDWASVKGTNPWFISYYLQKMKQASDSAGKRLLDVLDLHWYPEVTVASGRIVLNPNGDPVDSAARAARMQAPRSLWDGRYVENSWIVSSGFRSFLPLLPRLKTQINAFYPGTKIAFTEINYGAGNDISGGIATADMLGIFGVQGVYCSTLWQDIQPYQQAAYRIYRNYNGQSATFGDSSVSATMSDTANSSIYASMKGNELHIILINKHQSQQLDATITISSMDCTSGRVWAFNSISPAISETTPVSTITQGSFTYSVPKMSVSHLVLTGTVGVHGARGGRDGLQSFKVSGENGKLSIQAGQAGVIRIYTPDGSLYQTIYVSDASTMNINRGPSDGIYLVTFSGSGASLSRTILVR